MCSRAPYACIRSHRPAPPLLHACVPCQIGPVPHTRIDCNRQHESGRLGMAHVRHRIVTRGPAEHAGRTWSGTASPVVLWQQGNSPDRGPSPHSRTRGRTAVSRCCAARACKTSTCDPWRDRPVSAKGSERRRTRLPYKSKTYGSMLFASVRWNSTLPACRFTPWFTPWGHTRRWSCCEVMSCAPRRRFGPDHG